MHKRQTPVQQPSRNVIFIIDESGSIPQADFELVRDELAKLAYFMCDDAAIGLMTYSTHIRHHFCPKCLRTDSNGAALTVEEYRKKVFCRMHGAAYASGSTRTAAVINCLKTCYLTDDDCIYDSVPTDIIFFTDGRPNGCYQLGSVVDQVSQLISSGIGSSPNPPIRSFVIAMGDPAGLSSTFGMNFDTSADGSDNSLFFSILNISEFGEMIAKVIAESFETSNCYQYENNNPTPGGTPPPNILDDLSTLFGC